MRLSAILTLLATLFTVMVQAGYYVAGPSYYKTMVKYVYRPPTKRISSSYSYYKPYRRSRRVYYKRLYSAGTGKKYVLVWY
ncbi:uncharacterized protein LOC111049271 isoform X2 [Nilaparvata lugens]|uniref:uncharacterized protein LOC111049271 isoform X2 n=1 Tax=Nilaparvata lugens TaxID=108931 RepID=UPI00193EAECC|nr:uncharacterized protein LOC111049271 isoform X2 [Nilaparvata lugens]